MKSDRGGTFKDLRVFVIVGALFFLSMAYLLIFRLAFLFLHLKSVTDRSPFEIIHVFFTGARIDMVLISHLFIIPSILLITSMFMENGLKRIKTAIMWVFSLEMGVVFLLQIIEFEFFNEYKSRLNYLFFEYFSDAGDMFSFIWQGYPVIPYLLVWAGITTLFVFLLSIFYRKTVEHPPLENVHYTRKCIHALILTFLLILGVRGGFQSKPINWSYAYQWDSPFLNQLAMNGVYNLIRDAGYYLKESEFHKKEFTYHPFKETVQVLRGISGGNAKLLDDPDYPLLRKDEYQEKPNKFNVVLIMMESFTSRKVGVFGSQLGATPFFDRLTEEGVLFDNFYSTGTRTSRGLISLTASLPNLPGVSVLKKSVGQQRFRTIADILKERGYSTYFIYGGNDRFENMRGFLMMNGFEHIISRSSFREGTIQSSAGIYDHDMFERAGREFVAAKKPFFAIILTLTNHGPYTYPRLAFTPYPETVKHFKRLNTLKYSDWSLGQFFAKAKTQDYYKNTVFIIVADHGTGGENGKFDITRFHIPCLIIAPGLLQEKAIRDHRVGSQMDIPPTILSLLKIGAVHQFLGNDLFCQRTSKRYAFFLDDDWFGCRVDEYVYFEYLKGRNYLFRKEGGTLAPCEKDESACSPGIRAGIQKAARSYLQYYAHMLNERRCNIPWEIMDKYVSLKEKPK